MENKWNGQNFDIEKTNTVETAQYHRLVRDRIPEIIEAMGNIAVWRQLNEDEPYTSALLAEIVRIGSRFAESESLETLSDLFEAVDAWLEVKGLTMDEVEHARTEKRKRCGGFDRRLFLEYVAPGDDMDKRSLTSREC